MLTNTDIDTVLNDEIVLNVCAKETVKEIS